jgi:hypothetical protein
MYTVKDVLDALVPVRFLLLLLPLPESFFYLQVWSFEKV